VPPSASRLAAAIAAAEAAGVDPSTWWLAQSKFNLAQLAASDDSDDGGSDEDLAQLTASDDSVDSDLGDSDLDDREAEEEAEGEAEKATNGGDAVSMRLTVHASPPRAPTDARGLPHRPQGVRRPQRARVAGSRAAELAAELARRGHPCVGPEHDAAALIQRARRASRARA